MTSDDKGARCPNCDSGNIVLIREAIGEVAFCCSNSKCVVGEFTQKYLTKADETNERSEGENDGS